MTVISAEKDLDALTLTFVAEFAAPVERVWQLWEDARQLERWWGPPTWPATFERHELRPGGESRYFMTGPAGEKSGGWWTVRAVDPPRSIEFDDGFVGDNGEPNPESPVVRGRVDFESIENGTRMTITSRFASRDELQQLLDLGMEEGMTEAMGQIDDLLAADTGNNGR